MNEAEAVFTLKRARAYSLFRVMISATESGAILAAASPSPLQDRLAESLELLPELQRAAIALSLERIVDLMQIRQVEAAPILDTDISLQAHVTEQLPSIEGESLTQEMPPNPEEFAHR